IEGLTAKLEEFEHRFSLQHQQLVSVSSEGPQQVQQNLLIPVQKEELQPNVEARSEVEVVASLSELDTNGNTLEVAKETKGMDEPKNKVDELCPEMVEIVHRMLSKEQNYSVDEIIDCGFMSFLVRGLSIDDVKVQDLCAFGLAKITGIREQAAKVVEAGAIVPLIQLMTHSNPELARKATFAVCNIVGESAQLRDLVLQSNVVEALTTQCGKLADLSLPLTRMLSWMFSRICRHTDNQAPLEVLAMLVLGLVQLLEFEDGKVSTHACWALTYIASGTDKQRSIVRDSGVLPLVLKNLSDENGSLVEPAVKVLLNMTVGGDSMKQSVIDLGALRVLPEVVQKAKKASIVKECAMLIRNLMDGSKDQRKSLIDSGILTMILNV
ncbi:hypothetical protein PMAYCL1PPCAC_25721, partial [Pristionchus mayeri]